MNVEWLRYFLALADAGSFHAAAERVSVTPQALSKAIAGLESHFGLPLVERDRRTRGLTPAGEALRDAARALTGQLSDLERSMAAWRSPTPMGPLAIAGDGLWHHYLIPHVLAELVTEHPGVTPRLHEMLPDDIERWVLAGELDLGLLLRPPRQSGLHCREGLETPYVIVGRPQPMRAWDAFGYIVPRFFRRDLAESLDGWPEARYPRRVAAQVELLDTALNLAAAGVGVAFVPRLAADAWIRQGRLAIVAEAPCAFADQLFVVWREDVRPTPAARRFVELLEAIATAPS